MTSVSIPILITFVFWVVFIVYWIIDIYRINKKTVSHELQGLLSLTGTAIIIYLPVTWGILGYNILPSTLITNLIGISVCLSGILFAIWARESLGKNWSAAIAVQKEHKLIQSGPYGVVRHPMYTGLLLALLGSSITIGALWGFLITSLLTLGIIGKLNSEEKLLFKHFPNEYLSYKKRVKALIPFIY